MHTIWFLFQTKNGTYLMILIWVSFGAPDFLLELLCCYNGRRGPIFGLRHSDFYSTRADFHRRQNIERKGAIFHRSKSQRLRTNFHSYFLSATKKSIRVHLVLCVEKYACVTAPSTECRPTSLLCWWPIDVLSICNWFYTGKSADLTTDSC